MLLSFPSVRNKISDSAPLEQHKESRLMPSATALFPSSNLRCEPTKVAHRADSCLAGQEAGRDGRQHILPFPSCDGAFRIISTAITSSLMPISLFRSLRRITAVHVSPEITCLGMTC